MKSATPLAGIRALKFSHTVMGPTAGVVFAELSADVIKIELAEAGVIAARTGESR